MREWHTSKASKREGGVQARLRIEETAHGQGVGAMARLTAKEFHHGDSARARRRIEGTLCGQVGQRRNGAWVSEAAAHRA
ncbi:MAG: hypothetical protein ABJQ90_16345 [Parasphingorhabdus sp.]